MTKGIDIARAYHRDYNGFVRRIATKDEHELRQMAGDYADYINGTLPKQRQPLTAEQVLTRWRLAVGKVTTR